MKRGKPLPRGAKPLARAAGLFRGTAVPRTERKPAPDAAPSCTPNLEAAAR